MCHHCMMSYLEFDSNDMCFMMTTRWINGQSMKYDESLRNYNVIDQIEIFFKFFIMIGIEIWVSRFLINLLVIAQQICDQQFTHSFSVVDYTLLNYNNISGAPNTAPGGP